MSTTAPALSTTAPSGHRPPLAGPGDRLHGAVHGRARRDVVNVALPAIQRGLHFSAANLQWVVNAYTLVFGGFLLLGGRAADLIGRKRLFIAGVALFSFASLLNGLAQNSTMLIIGRGPAGPRRSAGLARRALDRHHDVHRELASAHARWAYGARSPPAAARSACCSAGCSPTSSRGSGSSSSTCRSG